MAQTKKQKEIVAYYTKAIKNGVKLLDTNYTRKKWLTKIDLKTLDLQFPYSCICGQVFGSYWDAQFKSFDSETFRKTDRNVNEFSRSHGFLAREGKWDEYDLLTNLWYVMIVKLKIEAGLIP